MASAADWRTLLMEKKWLDETDNLVAPGDSILRMVLAENRSFTIRGGKSGAKIKLSGEFFIVQETNVDTAGHSRITTIAASFVEAIEALI
jgi:hypothetical protein